MNEPVLFSALQLFVKGVMVEKEPKKLKAPAPGKAGAGAYSGGLTSLPDLCQGLPQAFQRSALASATVMAVMLTMRRTVAEGVRMHTGLAAPSRTGPSAMLLPAATFNKL